MYINQDKHHLLYIYWFVAFLSSNWTCISQELCDGQDEQEEQLLHPLDFLVNILNSIIDVKITITPPTIYSIEALLPMNKLATVLNTKATNK